MLVIENVEGNNNRKVVLPIALNNMHQITGLQFDLYLPEDVVVAKNEKGKMLVSTTERMEGSYTISCSNMDGFVRVVGYSAEGDAFTGNEGNILNITLSVGENIAIGDYFIRVKDIVLSDVNNTEYHPADIAAMFTNKGYTLGDVDNNGSININDVVCIINHILGKANVVFIEDAADVDYSGKINVNDVVALINRYILHRNNMPKRILAKLSNTEIDDHLYLENIEMNAGDIKEIEMKMSNSHEVRAVQGNIKLPDGFSFVTKDNGRLDVSNINSRSEDFTLSCALQEDGSMTFAQYSSDGFSYEGSDGGIFTFKIKADQNVASGEYNISLTDVVLSIDGVGYEISNTTSSINVTNTSIILDENSTDIPTATASDINITVNRTINANEWSTICLPFDMTEEQIYSAFGSDVKFAEFDSYDAEYDADDNVTAITINFSDADLSGGLFANYPYVIKTSRDISEFSVNATLVPEEENALVEYDNGKTGKRREVYGTFLGTYHAETVVPANGLFISGNKFYYSTGLTKMKAFRAYFVLEDVLSSVESTQGIRVKFNDDTTGVPSIERDGEEDFHYDLQGRCVVNPTRGIYIRDGKKVYIK